MSTSHLIGFRPGYIQPKLSTEPLSMVQVAQHSAIPVNPTKYNSTIDSFTLTRKAYWAATPYPTNPLSYEASLELHSQLALIFMQYDIKDINFEYIKNYLKLNSSAIKLLKLLPELIKVTFGDVLVAIKSLSINDDGDPLLEVKIESELPIDEAFDQNERTLFKRIDDLSLANALDTIVITYA